MSVGSPGSSDVSTNEERLQGVHEDNHEGEHEGDVQETVKVPNEKQKDKKLKKYKEGVEKVVSLFASSPKQQNS